MLWNLSSVSHNLGSWKPIQTERPSKSHLQHGSCFLAFSTLVKISLTECPMGNIEFANTVALQDLHTYKICIFFYTYQKVEVRNEEGNSTGFCSRSKKWEKDSQLCRDKENAIWGYAVVDVANWKKEQRSWGVLNRNETHIAKYL